MNHGKSPALKRMNLLKKKEIKKKEGTSLVS